MFFALFIVVQCFSLAQVQGLFCLFSSSPNQFRVALRGPNAVTISWRTSGYFGFNDTPNPKVMYGTSNSLLNAAISSVATTTSYESTSFFHNVVLSNLAPSTKYYYRILSSPTCVSQSGIQSFTTPPAPGSSAPVNITLVADLGNDNLINGGGASQTRNALLQAVATTNLFIHSGDISYADDYGIFVPFSFYEQTWNTWQNDMTAITANNIYMTAPGNHEVTCFQLGDSYCQDTNYRNFTAYLNRFRMPGDESGGFKNMWYSFDYGMVHVVVINTETDYPNAASGPDTALNGGNFLGVTQQQAWLAADLQAANANRARVPWILVTGHRPFFGSTPQPLATPDYCISCRSAFIPLMQQYNVDFYFCGHIHWYERLYPIDANGNRVATDYNNQPGPIYIINGAGGAPEGKASVQSAITASAKIVSAYGYTRLELKDASNARISFIDSSTLQEADSVNVFRQH